MRSRTEQAARLSRLKTSFTDWCRRYRSPIAVAYFSSMIALFPASVQARGMLPEKVKASDPAWRVEQKQLRNLAYARSRHGRWYRHAARWIRREHAELERRTIGPWMPTKNCESPGHGWDANTGNGYYGGIQFDYRTWLANGGGRFAPRADLATPIQQVTVAARLAYDGWPHCPNP